MLYINDTSQVELRERRFELAYEALCRLNTRDDLKHHHDPDTGEPCFHNMPSDYDRKCTNLIGILDRLGIIVERDELTGDIIGVSDELDLSEDFLTFLTVLARTSNPARTSSCSTTATWMIPRSGSTGASPGWIWIT